MVQGILPEGCGLIADGRHRHLRWWQERSRRCGWDSVETAAVLQRSWIGVRVAAAEGCQHHLQNMTQSSSELELSPWLRRERHCLQRRMVAATESCQRPLQNMTHAS